MCTAMLTLKHTGEVENFNSCTGDSMLELANRCDSILVIWKDRCICYRSYWKWSQCSDIALQDSCSSAPVVLCHFTMTIFYSVRFSCCVFCHTLSPYYYTQMCSAFARTVVQSTITVSSVQKISHDWLHHITFRICSFAVSNIYCSSCHCSVVIQCSTLWLWLLLVVGIAVLYSISLWPKQHWKGDQIFYKVHPTNKQ